jgi:hypothetical protein
MSLRDRKKKDLPKENDYTQANNQLYPSKHVSPNQNGSHIESLNGAFHGPLAQIKLQSFTNIQDPSQHVC